MRCVHIGGAWALGILAVALWSNSAAAQETRITGTLAVIWVDPPPQSSRRDTGPLLFLHERDGIAHRLVVTAAQVADLGGWVRLSDRRVTVRGIREPQAGADVVRVTQLSANDGRVAPLAVAPPVLDTILGTKRYVSVLCGYADQQGGDLPFDRQVITRWLGGSAPGMTHWFRDMSAGKFSLDASAVVGPVFTTKRAADYYPGGSRDFTALLNDCTAAADAQVDFSAYDGINLFIPGRISGVSNGTPAWPLTRDGVTRAWRVTWIAYWTPSIMAHEMGHSLSWAHPVLPASATVGSIWDIMSAGAVYDPAMAPPSYVQLGVALPHREMAGWIEPARALDVAPGTRVTVELVRASDVPVVGLQIAHVPLSGATYLTVEARRRVGYDARLPADAVVLNRIAPANGAAPEALDMDGDGDLSDATSGLAVGQAYRDATTGVLIRVDQQTPNGFLVTLSNTAFELTADVVGAGTVRSDDGNVVCPADCRELYGNTRVIHLTATPAGTNVFAGWGGDCVGSASCTVTVSGQSDRRITAFFAAPVVIQSPSTHPRGIVGHPYRASFLAVGGLEPIQWAVVAGAVPAGLTLTPAGILSGTPVAAVRAQFTVEARAGSLSARQAVFLDIVAPLEVTSTSLPPGAVGVSYRTVLQASGGAGAPTWSVERGPLPPGVTLDPTGGLNGTPTQAGSFSLRLRAQTDTLHAERDLALEIYERTGIVSASERPVALRGVRYSDTLQALFLHPGAIAWQVGGGALPDGLALGLLGAIEGVPTTRGTYTFLAVAATATDTSRRELRIAVEDLDVNEEALLTRVLSGVPLDASREQFIDFQGNRNGRVDIGDVRQWLQQRSSESFTPSALVRGGQTAQTKETK